jgi:hypothetical protein
LRHNVHLTADQTFAILGILVGVVGFGLAIYQLVLTKREIKRGISIAEATQEAVGQREQLGAVIELMATIPQIQRLERDLGVSVQAGNATAVVNQLQDWRKLVTETRGLIAQQNFDTSILESRLQESSNAAAQTIAQLDPDDLGNGTKWIFTQMAGVSDEAGVLMGKLRAHPGGERKVKNGK